MRGLISSLVAALSGVILQIKLDAYARQVHEKEPFDPVLIFAGEPPAYPDFVPDDYGVYEVLEMYRDHEIVCYRPRMWEYDADADTFRLHDQLDIGDTELEFREFTVEIAANDYVAHRIVNPMADWSDIPLFSGPQIPRIPPWF